MVKNPKKLSNMLQNLVDIVSGNNLCEEDKFKKLLISLMDIQMIKYHVNMLKK